MDIEVISESKASWGNRGDRIGASDLPIILGLSEYKSPADLWREKKGLVANEESFAALVGTAVENELFRQLTKNINVLRASQGLPAVDESAMVHNTQSLRNPNIAVWATATPDGFIGETDSIQIKYSKSKKKWDGTGVPQDVWVQVQWEMLVSNRKVSHLYCVLESGFGWDFQEIYYEVPLDLTYCHEALIPAAKKFWEALQMDECPFDLAKGIKLPEPVKAKVSIPDADGEAAAAKFLALKEEKAPLDKRSYEIDKEMKALKDKILLSFGDAQFIQVKDGTKIERRFFKKEAYTVAATEYYALYVKK